MGKDIEEPYHALEAYVMSNLDILDNDVAFWFGTAIGIIEEKIKINCELSNELKKYQKDLNKKNNERLNDENI